MYSKTLELAGMALIAVAVTMLAGVPYGLLTGGVCLLFVGGVTDDAAVGTSVRRGVAWVRYAWHRQLAKERGEQPERSSSPHPELRIDPETEARAKRQAAARVERAKVHDLTPALSRYDYGEQEEEG